MEPLKKKEYWPGSLESLASDLKTPEIKDGWISMLESRLADQAKWLSFERGKKIDCENSALTFVVAEADGPPHVFAVKRDTLQELKKAAATKGAELTKAEKVEVAIRSGGDTLSDFSTMAINDLNRAYYSCPDAFSSKSKLASFFTANTSVNHALARFVQDTSGKNPLRLLELSSGRRADRWITFARCFQPGRGLHVTLSDFDTGGLPRADLLPASEDTRFTRLALSLLEPFPELPESERYDTALVTYGFDSIWFPQDAHYTKHNGKLYKALFRLKLLDTAPRRKETLKAFSTGDFSNLRIEDLRYIAIEKTYNPVDLGSEPDGSLIESQFERTNDIPINYPGGLVNKVDEAFRTQLSADGTFIIGDVGNYRESGKMSHLAHKVSGLAARYKVEDYDLAAKILSKKGYNVRVWAIQDFVNEYLPFWQENTPEWEKAEVDSADGHFILAVRRRL